MAAKEPEYDLMVADEEAEEETAEGDLDPEFLMHAEGAGLSAEQAKSLKLAIERCNALKDEGAYEAPMEEDDEFEE